MINPKRMGQEFAMGTAVGGILGTGQLAGSNLADTASMKLARRGDYSGFVREMDGLIRQKKLDELMAEYEKHALSEKKHTVSEEKTPDNRGDVEFSVGRSLGAKAHNYEVVDKENHEIYSFAGGSKIQNAEIFAGAGARKPLREEVSAGLAKEFGGDQYDWQHAKGLGYLTQDGEETRAAEIHWFQANEIGKVKFKVKRWMDE